MTSASRGGRWGSWRAETGSRLNDMLLQFQHESLADAWANCDSACHLIELATLGLPDRDVVLATTECARLALRHVPADDDRVLLFIDAVESWAVSPTLLRLENVRTRAADCRDVHAHVFPDGLRMMIYYMANMIEFPSAGGYLRPHLGAHAGFALHYVAQAAGNAVAPFIETHPDGGSDPDILRWLAECRARRDTRLAAQAAEHAKMCQIIRNAFPPFVAD